MKILSKLNSCTGVIYFTQLDTLQCGSAGMVKIVTACPDGWTDVWEILLDIHFVGRTYLEVGSRPHREGAA